MKTTNRFSSFAPLTDGAPARRPDRDFAEAKPRQGRGPVRARRRPGLLDELVGAIAGMLR